MMKKFVIYIFTTLVAMTLLCCNKSFSDIGRKTGANDAEADGLGAKDILGNPDCVAFSFGGYRGATRETVPSVDELKEDLRILSAMGVKLIRTYNTQQFKEVENLLEAIEALQQEDSGFQMYVMLGTWIDCEGAWGPKPNHDGESLANNSAEIGAAVKLANKYPKSVKMIAVGNEAMVHWAPYRVQPGVILKWVNHLQDLKKEGKLSSKVWITSSDNFASWGGEGSAYHKPELEKLFQAVDFVSVHVYPFHETHYASEYWIVPESEAGLSPKKKADAAVNRAMDRAKTQFGNVRAYMESLGVNKPLHIGETGWASVCDKLYGEKGSRAADEYKSKRFHDLMRAWTKQQGLSCFYFEAFDEKWKDPGSADGSENHFGLIDLEGRAKFALWDHVDAGVFTGLTRGGKPITKTFGGDESAMMATLLPVPEKANWNGSLLENVNSNREIGSAVSENTYIVSHKTMTPVSVENATFPSLPLKLNAWEGSCELKQVDSELHITTGTGNWWGCALEIQSTDKGENLSRFRDGKLSFEIRGTTKARFLAGFQTGRFNAGNQTNNGVKFGPGEKYALTHEWKSWSIPIAELLEVDPKANLENVTSQFFLKSDEDLDGKELQFRNVTFSVE
jgi:exo-beta-1,3-glucanase (GH17 family)